MKTDPIEAREASDRLYAAGIRVNALDHLPGMEGTVIRVGLNEATYRGLTETDLPELADICNLFGYGEIKPLGSRYYESSMLNLFRRLDADNFQTVVIERKEDIWPSFRAFLSKDRAKLADAGATST
jgi:hypothetical protein